jgi:hypothetical protein
MQVSGFSVIRNAELMGYPVLQSIQSLLPLVDELVIGVGQSEDRTKEMILSLNSPKIKIFDSFWDPAKRTGGLILSEKTNEALAKCSYDWCVYLQADEVLHERDLMPLMNAIRAADKDPRIQGLLLKYVHFYGAYDVIATSRRWYRNEVRVVRKSSGIQSVGDAQGFRVSGRKPQVLRAPAAVYHYGWVKPPQQMGEKTKRLNWLWHGNAWDHKSENFRYDRQYGLKKYTGSHPAVMRELIQKQTWEFDPTRRLSDWKLKDLNLWASDVFERVTGYRIGEYKPYQLVD